MASSYSHVSMLKLAVLFDGHHLFSLSVRQLQIGNRFGYVYVVATKPCLLLCTSYSCIINSTKLSPPWSWPWGTNMWGHATVPESPRQLQSQNPWNSPGYYASISS